MMCASVSFAALTSGCWSYDASGMLEGVGGSPGSGGTSNAGGTPSSAGSVTVGPGTLPCDVLEGAGHPCVSAHSTVRRLVR